MSELLHIQAPSVVVSDLHTHVLNLAAVIAHPGLNPQLRERLDGLPCHPDVLAAAQARCRERERCQDDEWFGVGLTTCEPDLDWAVDYFVCAWLSRNGCAGTKGEFNAGHSVRWDAGGGDSATRFRNATDGLAAWQGVMRFCSFVRLDVFKFLLEVKDEPEHGVYCDPPFPDVGDSYKFRFDEQDQRRLAKKLTGFKRLRVVVRFYDHPLVRAQHHHRRREGRVGHRAGPHQPHQEHPANVDHGVVTATGSRCSKSSPKLPAKRMPRQNRSISSRWPSRDVPRSS
jgi:hypothetical protein